MSEINQLNIDNTIYNIRDKRGDWTFTRSEANTPNGAVAAEFDLTNLPSLAIEVLIETSILLDGKALRKVVPFIAKKSPEDSSVMIHYIGAENLTVDGQIVRFTDSTYTTWISIRYRVIN